MDTQPMDTQPPSQLRPAPKPTREVDLSTADPSDPATYRHGPTIQPYTDIEDIYRRVDAAAGPAEELPALRAFAQVRHRVDVAAVARGAQRIHRQVILILVASRGVASASVCFMAAAREVTLANGPWANARSATQGLFS